MSDKNVIKVYDPAAGDMKTGTANTKKEVLDKIDSLEQGLAEAGKVETVNSVKPDSKKNVELTGSNIKYKADATENIGVKIDILNNELDTVKQSGVKSNKILVDALNSKEVTASTNDAISINVQKVNDIHVGDYSIGDTLTTEQLEIKYQNNPSITTKIEGVVGDRYREFAVGYYLPWEKVVASDCDKIAVLVKYFSKVELVIYDVSGEYNTKLYSISLGDNLAEHNESALSIIGNSVLHFNAYEDNGSAIFYIDGVKHKEVGWSIQKHHRVVKIITYKEHFYVFTVRADSQEVGLLLNVYSKTGDWITKNKHLKINNNSVAVAIKNDYIVIASSYNLETKSYEITKTTLGGEEIWQKKTTADKAYINLNDIIIDRHENIHIFNSWIYFLHNSQGELLKQTEQYFYGGGSGQLLNAVEMTEDVVVLGRQPDVECYKLDDMVANSDEVTPLWRWIGLRPYSSPIYETSKGVLVVNGTSDGDGQVSFGAIDNKVVSGATIIK